MRFVKAILKKGVNANALVERVGGRPLIAAVYGGQEEIVRLLLDAGADPNLQGNWITLNSQV